VWVCVKGAVVQVGKAACGLQVECPAGKYSYLIRSGVERDGSPTVCFNGHVYVDLLIFMTF